MSDLIIKRLNDIEARLSNIETHLDLQAVSKTNSLSNTPNENYSSPCYAEEIKDNNESSLDSWANEGETIKPVPDNLPSDKNENITPTNWLGYAAIICFVLAAGFIIKLSIESGWLSVEKRLGMSAFLGGGLIISGLFLMKTDRKYASLLPGAGIVILYLTTFAAHRYYSLISLESSLLLISLVSCLCIALYAKIKHDVYAVVASAGTYLSPLVLNFSFENIFSIYYFLICSVAFATISVFLKSRLLILIPAYLAIVLTALAGMEIHNDVVISVSLGMQFLIFSLSTFFYSKQHKTPLSEMEAWSFLPVLVVFYASEYFFLDRINPAIAPWVSLGFGGVLLGLYMLARKLFPNGFGSQHLILSFVTLVLFHSAYIELLPKDVHPWLLTAMVLACAFIPYKSSYNNIRTTFTIPVAALCLIAVLEYGDIIYQLFSGRNSPVLAAIITLGSIWMLLVNKSDMIRQKEDMYYGLLASAHLLAILGLYRLTTDIGSLAVSASWLFYAVATILFAMMRKDQLMARSALFVLTFAAGKALLYDASSAPTLVRIFCLLLTGVVLYGCGFLIRKIGSWRTAS